MIILLAIFGLLIFLGIVMAVAIWLSEETHNDLEDETDTDR